MSATVNELPLSYTQRYFLGVIAQEGFDPTWQHVAFAIQLGQELETARVEDVVAKLEARHPVLATRLAYRDGDPYLMDCSGTGRACQILDLTAGTEAEFGVAVARAIDTPFDLLRGPAWRLVVARGPKGRNVVAFVCHHLVGDMVSNWMLLKDFGILYFGGELDPQTEPYTEFVRAERDLLAGDGWEQRLGFWRNALDGASPLLRVERRPDPGELGAGSVLRVAIEQGAGESLTSTARGLRVTPLILLCGATFAAVERATGQEDVLMGLVTDTRGARFARTVGAFSDLLFVRDTPRVGQDEGARLTALRNQFYSGWQHHLPFASLREQVPAFSVGGTVALNPCDLYLNFIPMKTSSDWWNLIAPYRDESTDIYIARERMGSPTRRLLGPLYFVQYLLAPDLTGVLVVHRQEPLETLNQSVAAELGTSLKRVLAPATPTPA